MTAVLTHSVCAGAHAVICCCDYDSRLQGYDFSPEENEQPMLFKKELLDIVPYQTVINCYSGLVDIFN